ncbi:MAG TPA: hypothetical protein VFO18_17185 [Methylomirabilota bacterium]|nr:hypothetical protein [Methylomirabilota bacterium]
MLGRPAGPRLVEGRLTASVPIETALALEGHAGGDEITVSILEDGQPLTSGTVRALAVEPARDGLPWRPEHDGWPLPMSEGCLACGAVNPLGLQARLRFDEQGVWASLTPREPWRAAGGGLHPAFAPVLLDEIAWWLAALRMKEGGLTNRIRLTLLRAEAPFTGPLLAAGRFADVKPIDRKRSFWRTETALLGPEGRLLATASIVFRGGPDYSVRQMEYFRPRTPPEIFRRMFPNYARESR